jgi:hypothetical protein
MILFATLVLGRPRYRLTIGSLLMLGSLIVPAYLTLRTYRDHGIATPTMVGIRSGREYLQAKYVAEQSGGEFVAARDSIRAEDLQAAQRLTEPESLTARRYLVAQEKFAEFVWTHPGDVTRLMAMEFARQMIAPQGFAASVLLGHIPTAVKILAGSATLLLLAFAGIGAFYLSDRRLLFVSGIYAFYLATGSLTQFNGSRLRFPADMAAIPLVAIGVTSLRRPGVSNCGDKAQSDLRADRLEVQSSGLVR